MSISSVKRALDSIASCIATETNALTQAKTRITTAVANLNTLPTIHASTVSEINAYTPTGAFQTLAKDELAKLTPEFQALRTAAQGAVTALAEITEF
jgi:hypothetical protein